MLLRREADAVIGIPQPSHSWVSGQLARYWGGDGFEPIRPYEEVCLGAEQHDIGWLDWEAAPTLNAATGLPYEFHELPARTHTTLWTRGVQLARAFGTYPALLVSLHSKTIYTLYFDIAQAPAEEATAVRTFLDCQEQLRTTLEQSIRSDPRYTEVSSEEAFDRNRRLVAAWDRMSLEICWGVTEPRNIPDVPGVDGVKTIVMRPRKGDTGELVVEPWPFRIAGIDLFVEGRRLQGRYADEAAMRQAWNEAGSRVSLTIRLTPP